MLKFKLAVVLWEDSCHLSGWLSTEASYCMTPPILMSIGWVVRLDKHRITLTQSRAVTGDEAVGSTISIPRSSVIQIEYIESDCNDEHPYAN